MLVQETTDSTTRLISILSLCVATASFVISGLSLAFTIVTHRKVGRRIKVQINYWRKEDKTEEFRLTVHNYGSEDVHISRWWIQGKQGVRQRIGRGWRFLRKCFNHRHDLRYYLMGYRDGLRNQLDRIWRPEGPDWPILVRGLGEVSWPVSRLLGRRRRWVRAWVETSAGAKFHSSWYWIRPPPRVSKETRPTTASKPSPQDHPPAAAS
jgi:hypothetical protein